MAKNKVTDALKKEGVLKVDGVGLCICDGCSDGILAAWEEWTLVSGCDASNGTDCG